MSLDTFVSSVMLLVALILMMRFGCGAHLGALHAREMSDSGRAGDADARSPTKEQQK